MMIMKSHFVIITSLSIEDGLVEISKHNTNEQVQLEQIIYYVFFAL